MMNLNGKVALVTGGGSGIGAATAAMLAQRGAAVMLFDLDGVTAGAVRDDIVATGARAAMFAGDVSDSDACTAAVAETVAQFGSLDILVNNAGGGKLVPTEALSDADWRRMQAINIDGTFYMTRAALHVMLDRGSGAIVNIASVHGLVGYPSHAGYTAAKGAIVNLTRSLGIEYGARNIRVNAICPGVILTPLIENSLDEAGIQFFTAMHPIGRLGRPDEIASAVCFLASDEASFITGTTLAVDGGYTAQ